MLNFFDHIKKPNIKKRPKAVLKINPAGIGDMLCQVSDFYWVCEAYSLRPYLEVTQNYNRNSMNPRDALDMLGLYSKDLTKKSKPIFYKKLTIPEFIKENRIGQPIKKGSIKLTYPLECYEGKPFRDFISSISKNQLIHPDLSKLVRKSPLISRVLSKKNEKTKHKVCVHVRRGDVTQFPIKRLESLMKPEHVDDKKIAHIHGIFKDSDELERTMHHSFYSRFKPIEAFIEALEKIPSVDKSNVILLSDGMTSLSKYLHNYAEMFRNESISQWQIERELERELYPIVEKCSFCLIGENSDNLIESIIEGLSSDVIISSSNTLFRMIANYAGLDIEFISV